MNDLNLVKSVKENSCSDSLIELAKLHSGLYVQITSKHSSKIRDLDYSDIEEEKFIILLNACKSFDENKNIKFCTWFGRCVRYHWLTILRNQKRELKRIYQYLPITSDSEDPSFLAQSAEDDPRELEISEIVKNLNETDRQILNVRYNSLPNKNLPWRAVSEKLNLSKDSLRKRHKKILKNILKKYERSIK